MVVLIGITSSYYFYVASTYNSLARQLPLDMAMAMDKESRRSMKSEMKNEMKNESESEQEGLEQGQGKGVEEKKRSEMKRNEAVVDDNLAEGEAELFGAVGVRC